MEIIGQRRIFIAFDISEEARRAAREHIDGLRSEFPEVRCRWVTPENLHLTAWFVGNVDDVGLTKVEQAVSETASRTASFQIALEGTGKFTQHRSHTDVLWIGAHAEPAHSFVGIAKALADDTRVKPHLTIARLKHSPRSKELVAAHLEMRFRPIEFPSDHLTIYESVLGPTGSTYTPLSRHSLRKA